MAAASNSGPRDFFFPAVGLTIISSFFCVIIIEPPAKETGC
jgi:hypothetical protein